MCAGSVTGLLIINLIYFIGQSLLGALEGEAEAPLVALDKNAEPVRLVREVPDRVVRQEQTALALLQQAEVVEETADVDDSAAAALCAFWGPFLSSVAAEELLQALPVGARGHIKESVQASPAQYWVYLPARDSRAEALLLARGANWTRCERPI